MARNGKRMRALLEGIDREKTYPVKEAVHMVKEGAKAKFDETIEMALNLGIDPRHADQMVRGVMMLPNGTGKPLRVAVALPVLETIHFGFVVTPLRGNNLSLRSALGPVWR